MVMVNPLLRTTQIMRRSFGATKRCLSTAANQESALTNIALDEQTKIATLTLSRLPANALSLELMRRIRSDIEQLETSDCRGVVITSASERIFCAGLDLREVHRSERDHLTVFWRALQDMWRTLFGTQLPVAGLINGHALAGGCMIATCCDFRVMLPNFLIGLNETKAGIAVPRYVIDAYVNAMGNLCRAEVDLTAGLVYNTEDALRVGLVDAVASTKEAAMVRCLEYFDSYKGVNNRARGLTKLQFRSDIIEDFTRTRERDVEYSVQTLLSAEFKAFLGDYLQTMGAKANKKRD